MKTISEMLKEVFENQHNKGRNELSSWIHLYPKMTLSDANDYWNVGVTSPYWVAKEGLI